MKRFVQFFFFTILLLTITYSAAQDMKKSDSLISIYHQQVSERQEVDPLVIYEIARNHNNPDTILYYAQALIEQTKKLKDKRLYLFRGYYYSGIANKLKGSYDRALSDFYDGADVARHIDCQTCLAATYVAIGNVFSVSQSPGNAIAYYKKAIELSLASRDSLFIASTSLSAGNEYLIIDKLDSANYHFTEAYKIFSKLNNEVGVAYSLGNIGKIYTLKREFGFAEKNIMRAITILEKYHDSYALSIYYGYLSEIYKARRDVPTALNYAHISLNIAEGAGLLPQIRDAYQVLTELYAMAGKLDKAFECQTNYIDTRDSINNEATIRKMADLRTEYEVAQKQAEVDLLQKKRQNQRIMLSALIMVLVFTFGLFFIFYTHSNKRKKLAVKLVQRQKELQEQHDELEKANKTKDRFFSIISHDLRGPINVLNGTTLLIRDFLNSKNYDELEELTSNMEYSVKKVQNLLDNLLEWAVSQQGEFPCKPETLDLEEICDEVLNIFIAMAATKSINLTYEIKSDARYLYADRNSLMTILRNLVSNALKFTDKNGSVSILATISNGMHCLSVSDTGVGIEPEKQENLFKLNETKSTWGTSKEKGLGIGLSLVHEFVKMNKGTISVDSTLGEGSVFTVYFSTNGHGELNNKKSPKSKLFKSIKQKVT
ncbi:MAG: tetratricopeptide repeat-containing sensor histidine kinase [Bacteroidota bacterium]|nr:MAG: tetratricopeptide repeat-containing sensor histidine kinase [Bacteroidota bacterium]